MDTNKREYDNNIYIKTELCIYTFFLYIQYIFYLFILTMWRIMKAREKEKEKEKNNI